MILKNTLAHISDLKITEYEEYDKHSVVVSFIDPETKIQGFVSFYRMSSKYPAFGATRIWPFSTLREGLQDSMLLAKTMMYKNAMAGTPYTGAKGVIVAGSMPHFARERLLKRYAEFVNFLSGRFITGADIGVSSEDVKLMGKISSNYIVGMKVDPVKHTVNGLLVALDVAVKEVYGQAKDALTHKTIAVQGVGKTGALLIDSLHNKVKNIIVADIDGEGVSIIQRKYKNIKLVSPSEIYQQKVDIFCPCALGGVINKETIKTIRADIILGSANNQLQNATMGEILHRMGIFYAPDYIVNAGGVMSVIHEYENKKINKELLDQKVAHIGDTLKKVISYSKKHHISIKAAADTLARKIIDNRYSF